MVQYDATVIQAFAESLYKRANSIIATYSVLGLILGFVVGLYLPVPGGEAKMVVATVIGLAIGVAVGRQKAFLLKLQAQTSLCQVKIEQNTTGKNG